jgi:RNA polymerase sigma-70 factor (ECF subfamily)
VILSSNKSGETPESENFAELVADHQARLHGYIRSLIPDAHVAKDVLQETNMVLLRKARDFKMGTNFSAWALRVAFFEVLSWRRNAGRDRLVFDDDTVERIAEQAETLSADEERRREALIACLAKLPQRQRDVVRRRYLDGQSVASIAEHSGLKCNAVSQLLFRAKRNLARCISGALSRGEGRSQPAKGATLAPLD